MARRKLGDILLEAKPALQGAARYRARGAAGMGRAARQDPESRRVSSPRRSWSRRSRCSSTSRRCGSAARRSRVKVLDMVPIELCERYCMIPFVWIRVSGCGDGRPQDRGRGRRSAHERPSSTYESICRSGRDQNAVSVHYRGRAIGDANEGKGFEFEVSATGGLQVSDPAPAAGRRANPLAEAHRKPIKLLRFGRRSPDCRRSIRPHHESSRHATRASRRAC